MDLLELDATGQAELVRNGSVSPADLVRASMQAIETLDPQLDAILHRTLDFALAQAKGPIDRDAPFCGVPMVLKDYGCEVAGYPYSFAALPMFRNVPFVSPEDSHLGAAFKQAGFCLVGRSNTPLGGIVFPTHDIDMHVMPRNPWNPDYFTGGSSSGSAAAVASRMVAVGHGNDGGGSIRLPASLCGLVGLKPTRGRVSMGPGRSEFSSTGASWASEFAMTRSVRDTARLLNAVQGWAPGDSMVVGDLAPIPSRQDLIGRPLRIGVTTTSFFAGLDVHGECRQAAEDTAKVLEGLGHRVEIVDPPQYSIGAHEWDYGMPGAPAFTVLARYTDIIKKIIGRELPADDLGPQLWVQVEMGRLTTGRQLLEFSEVLQDICTRWDRWWLDAGFDLLLSPTVAARTAPMADYLPPPHGNFVIPEDNPLIAAAGIPPFIGFTQMFNFTGQPAITLPTTMGEHNLPIGVQLVADRLREDLLLQVAYELEEAMPWADRKPAICA